MCRLHDHAAEIHCHGGDACVQRILSDLRNAGFAKAHIAARPLDQALTLAPTLRTAQLLLRQRRLWADAGMWLRTASSTNEVREFAAAVLEWTEFGLHLTEPWQVVILGPPNAGKSTLINTILGYERSIVFNEPGTTRDVVSARTVIDGWPILVSDTAGLRTTADEIEAEGVAFAANTAAEADLCLIVDDLTDRAELACVPPVSRKLRVGTKIDLAQPNGVHDVCVSALTGEGMEQLLSDIGQSLVPDEPPSEQCVPVSQSHAERLIALRDCPDGTTGAAVGELLTWLSGEH